MSLTLDALEAQDGLSGGRALVKSVAHCGLTIEARCSDSDVWIIFRRGGDGGLALRTSVLQREGIALLARDGASFSWTAENSAGTFKGVFTAQEGAEQFSHLVTFTPSRDIHIPYLPRDLVPFGPKGDPSTSAGKVLAKQRRLNTGLCYLDFARPKMGKVLYVQNLTALNPYFQATRTTPENAVGGEWPNLGYLPPAQPADPTASLAAGQEITLYDTRLVFRFGTASNETDNAWQFLDMLAAIYRGMDRPGTEPRDWPERSAKTLDHLQKSPKVRQRHAGQVYFHPYVDAEYPDSMVQLSLLSAVHDWGEWSGKTHPVEREILKGLDKFYDPKLKALRRYLPNVGEDKNRHAVDSWYLYHPLLNLANVALAGNEEAKTLFLKCIDYGIRAAQHFEYKWPIQYDIRNFAVLTAVAGADNRGQTDVGGIYAWVMLQAFELTSDTRFLDEARNALDSARGMRFELNYQANLTAWGAAACIRLWRITNEKTYLGLSYVYLASFFHNAQIWESQIGHAVHYSNFLGVTCLQDAPYMALYECFDSFAAFERFLDLGGPDLIASAQLMVTEYCRYALYRAWFYYPDVLPPEALASENRNGHIDRKLSFPLEDLYPDGQPAGQVGQEIYGAGAALIFATRSVHRIDHAPFEMSCDHFLRAITRLDERSLALTVLNGEAQPAVLMLRPKRGRVLKGLSATTFSGEAIEPQRLGGGVVRLHVPLCSGLTLSWR